MVSWRPEANAVFSFVPTPSVPLTRIGSLYAVGNRQSAANPPIPPRTSGRIVDFASGLIRSTRAFPASISTPASLYVIAICGLLTTF